MEDEIDEIPLGKIEKLHRHYEDWSSKNPLRKMIAVKDRFFDNDIRMIEMHIAIKCLCKISREKDNIPYHSKSFQNYLFTGVPLVTFRLP